MKLGSDRVDTAVDATGPVDVLGVFAEKAGYLVNIGSRECCEESPYNRL